MKWFVAFFLLALAGVSHAQHYQYRLLSGWLAGNIFETEDSSYVIFGLTGDAGSHGIQCTKLGKDLDLVNQISIAHNGHITSLRTSYFSSVHDGIYRVCGFYDSSNSVKVGLLLSIDKQLNIVSSKRELLGFRTFALQSSFTNENDYNSFGVIVPDSILGKSHIQAYFARYSGDSLQRTSFYKCSGFSQQGGCEVVLRQVLKLDDGFLMACDAQTYYYRDALIDPLLIRIDSSGKELWRRNLGNSTTSGLNVLVAPLANGNFLATYVDHYWKPFKDPEGGPNQDSPTPNKFANIHFVEVTPEGRVDSTWNIKQEIKFIGVEEEYAYFHHTIVSKDGSLLFAGHTLDQGRNGAYMGNLLKLDKNGNYQWYRQIQLNINGGKGSEELYLYGVTELSQGGFALAGEYRSQPSDSFPTGTQQAVVMFVDEYGCFEPGCRLKDGIVNQKLELPVTLYPNPSTGSFTLKVADNYYAHKLNYSVFNALGSQVASGSFIGETQVHLLPSGIYVVEITDAQNQLRSTLKYVISR